MNTMPNSQRGVVLFLALIFLVAMTLAGVALVRSVDTGNIIAGNVAFKKSALMSSDRGIQIAYQWLSANQSSLNSDSPGSGYFSSLPANGGSPGSTADVWNDRSWVAESAWSNAVTLAADGAGNTTQYVIQRMCKVAGTAFDASGQSCIKRQIANNSQGAGGLEGGGSSSYKGQYMVYYRVTSRVKGPRNAVSITQSTVTVNS
jgi:Tfp pilus assembly protein PilX